MSTPRFLLPLCFLLPVPLHAGGITWKADLRGTQREAADHKRVVFVAVNMDGERANERMVKDVYANKRILELAGHTLNLVASNDSHAAEGKTCPRFGGITCTEHRHVDADVRSAVLAPDAQGFVVAPQHVFLGPDGSVLLSVPYEIRVEELEWCFVTALRSVDPAAPVEFSEKARAPKRLVMAGVYTIGAAAEAAPLTREAALELVSELKKGMVRGAELQKARRRLAMADEPEARDYLLGILRTAPGRAGGGNGGGKAGGGGVGAGAAAAADRTDRRPLLMHWIGANSPASYWEVCAEFIDENVIELRREAVVALEQLGSPQALKLLLARLHKEKDEHIAKNLLRAVGTCGADDNNARKALLKQAGDDRKPLLQVNAIVALGWLTNHGEITDFLGECLTEQEGAVRIAAILAMAISRNEVWVETLKAALENSPDAPLREALEAALAVLQGGPLAGLEGLVGRVASDELTRERIFGKTPREGDSEGGDGDPRGGE